MRLRQPCMPRRMCTRRHSRVRQVWALIRARDDGPRGAVPLLDEGPRRAAARSEGTDGDAVGGREAGHLVERGGLSRTQTGTRDDGPCRSVPLFDQGLTVVGSYGDTRARRSTRDRTQHTGARARRDGPARTIPLLDQRPAAAAAFRVPRVVPDGSASRGRGARDPGQDVRGIREHRQRWSSVRAADLGPRGAIPLLDNGVAMEESAQIFDAGAHCDAIRGGDARHSRKVCCHSKGDPSQGVLHNRPGRPVPSFGHSAPPGDPTAMHAVVEVHETPPTMPPSGGLGTTDHVGGAVGADRGDAAPLGELHDSNTTSEAQNATTQRACMILKLPKPARPLGNLRTQARPWERSSPEAPNPNETPGQHHGPPRSQAPRKPSAWCDRRSRVSLFRPWNSGVVRRDVGRTTRPCAES